jgi:hypothetical protein
MEDLKNLTKRVFSKKPQTPEKPKVKKEKPPKDFADSDEDEDYGNDDNLQDDIEDKNASFNGAAVSTNNTSRSGNSSESDKSSTLVSRILRNRAARKQ